MKKVLKNLIIIILVLTIWLNFNASNIYASSMTEQGTTDLIETAGGGSGLLGGIADGIVGVLTIFLRGIVVGVAGAFQGVITAIANADGKASTVRMAYTR